MAANPHSHGSSAESSSSPAAFPHAPTAPHTGGDIPQASKQLDSWRRNPAHKGRDGAEAPWIPGQSMPHWEQLQLVRGASFNQYKYIPPPPSAEYLAMKLSNNPLGLIDMTPVSLEEYYLQGQPNADAKKKGRSHKGVRRRAYANRSHSPHANHNSHALHTGSSENASSATVPSPRLTTSPPPHARSTSPGAHDAQPPARVRRGYWNQRGDHLTPDRYIVYAPPDRAFPAELAAYPLEEVGYRNHDGAWLQWAERPELPESLPRRGRAPERPYDDFVVYLDRAPMESLAPPRSRSCSIDSLPNGLLSEPFAERHSREHASATASSISESNLMRKDDADFLSKAGPSPSRVDPWDLDARLTALSLRRPKSPTSSSSSYGSPQSVRSRASSWSCSPGGHIPGTNRDVLEFPFGYLTTPI